MSMHVDKELRNKGTFYVDVVMLYSGVARWFYVVDLKAVAISVTTAHIIFC
jgi:hypothetical protein